MKALVFLAEGFEEVEALTPVDMLRRAGIEVVTVGIGGTKITGTHGITVAADIADNRLHDLSADIIVLPGGMPGTLNLDNSSVVHRALDAAVENDSFICAICAAPRIPGKLGMLDGKRATCYPGNEKYMNGALLDGSRTVTDGKFITACGMGAANEFSLAIIAAALGADKASELRESTLSASV